VADPGYVVDPVHGTCRLTWLFRFCPFLACGVALADVVAGCFVLVF
jgi:hypothetical protein